MLQAVAKAIGPAGSWASVKNMKKAEIAITTVLKVATRTCDGITHRAEKRGDIAGANGSENCAYALAQLHPTKENL